MRDSFQTGRGEAPAPAPASHAASAPPMLSAGGQACQDFDDSKPASRVASRVASRASSRLEGRWGMTSRGTSVSGHHSTTSMPGAAHAADHQSIGTPPLSNRGSGVLLPRPSSDHLLVHKKSITDGLISALRTITSLRISDGSLKEDENLPDLLIDVVFIFKKALEVKRDAFMTGLNMPEWVQEIVRDLDPQHTGVITRDQLISYVQSTCAYANMVRPTDGQVWQTFKGLDLGHHELLDTDAVKAELLGLPWSIMAYTPKPTAHHSCDGGLAGRLSNSSVKSAASRSTGDYRHDTTQSTTPPFAAAIPTTHTASG